MKLKSGLSKTINNFTLPEEIWHAITHGVGLFFSLIGLVVLIAYATLNGSTLAIVSSAIFGTTLVIMYGSSTLYHALTHKKLKEVFQTFDHASIYLLIAGTYTPITLYLLQAYSYGMEILLTEWLTAIFGIYMKFKYPKRFETLSLILYVLMGWLIVIAISPLREVLVDNGFYLLVAGGVTYTLGVYFYINDSKPYYHAVWHLFVLGGSVFHYFMILLYVI
ncbi:hemolysin III family protein [Sulfurimonas sp. SAG-AH-194-L11]|nr:hemolysin III family protein [Sulfurimonas sp. SAG-AH-194-L11]MDF1877087.1 hemolysin III family protein [Sulfurimonas sp. SAG-AH-194-L11]